MMMPSIFGENLFDDFDSWFSDPVEKRFFGKKNPLYGKEPYEDRCKRDKE